MKLTPRTVERIDYGALLEQANATGRTPAGNTPLFVWDDEVLPRGFGVMLQPSGHKSFILQYRTREGVSRRYTIGTVGTWKLEQAREEARALRVSIDRGGDPVVERRQGRERAEHTRTTAERTNGHTVEKVAEKWIAEGKSRKGKPWSALHKREVERIFAKYVNPQMGARPISAVTAGDVHKLLQRVAQKHGGVMANKVLQRIRSLFQWATKPPRQLVSNDPTTGLDKPGAEKMGTRVLEDHELAWVWRAAEALPYPRGDYLKLILLLGQRRTETATMLASEIDRTNRIWQPGKSKSDAYQEFPLSDAVWAVVEPLLREADKVGRDFLLVSEPDNPDAPPMQDYDGVLDTIRDKIAELQTRKPSAVPIAKWRPWAYHSLRRTMRTTMPRLKVPALVAELCLGHTKKGIIAVYDHYEYREEKREAFAKWAQHVAAVA